MFNISLFASGEGTNAENLMRYFKDSERACIKVIISNHYDAGVLKRAQTFGVPTEIIDKNMLEDANTMLPLLEKYDTDIIVLAGFLMLLPSYFIKHFAKRIVNIHPSLIPLHCGKGMYGMTVHEDVIQSGDTETGITVHLVDEDYDHGTTILQERCKVLPGDTAEVVAQRVHKLEYKYYPKALEMLMDRL